MYCYTVTVSQRECNVALRVLDAFAEGEWNIVRPPRLIYGCYLELLFIEQPRLLQPESGRFVCFDHVTFWVGNAKQVQTYLFVVDLM